MRLALPILWLLVATPVLAQHEHHPPSSSASLYAGQETRAIKALSPEEITAYQQGAGMGLARAAELNGYPGPRHVLELADSLALTPTQRYETQAIFDAMHQVATRLGEEIIAKEAALDRLFAEEWADAGAVAALVDDLGALQARLRFTHLNAHLALKPLLTPEQVARYQHLRGYRHP